MSYYWQNYWVLISGEKENCLINCNAIALIAIILLIVLIFCELIQWPKSIPAQMN